MNFRAVKGMNDILPGDVERWQRLEAAFRETAELHGYAEVRTPLVEPTELFVRSIGETTDVVEKEMYSFEHRGESLTLRPEGTAGAVRAYVEHAVATREPVTRWYYVGPMFRAERPQRGRYRQFWQAGCEILGDAGPACDAELIDMLVGLLRRVGIGDLEVCLSSIGGPDARARYREALLAYLRPRAGALGELSRARLETNPLRILDSKDPADRATVAGAPSIVELLLGDDRAHFEELQRQLERLGVAFRVEPGLVRGLDYYTRTLFEIRSGSGELGAQNTLCGGGRYDGMVEQLGGPAVPAIGFAMGLERILLAMPAGGPAAPPLCFVAPLGAEAGREALVLGRELRALGIRTEVDARGGSLRSLLRRADARGARCAVVVGEAELQRGVVAVKDLAAHAQSDVPRVEAAARIAGLLGRAAEEMR